MNDNELYTGDHVAHIVPETLTDGSRVWNVVYWTPTATLRIGATDHRAARRLANCLDGAAWLTIDPRPEVTSARHARTARPCGDEPKT